MATTSRTIKLPGSDHPITITPMVGNVTVSLDGQVIARSSHALTLQEANYPPVQYIPRADIDLAALLATGHTTYCPYKGVASYYSIPAGGARSVNAIWSYEDPHDAVAAIKDHMAFYPDRIDTIDIG
jgi:uncharacterized protein (DUF427 family)